MKMNADNADAGTPLDILPANRRSFIHRQRGALILAGVVAAFASQATHAQPGFDVFDDPNLPLLLPPNEGWVPPPGPDPGPGPCLGMWCGAAPPPWQPPSPAPVPPDGGCMGLWCGPGDPPWLTPGPGPNPPADDSCAGLWCGPGKPPWVNPPSPPGVAPPICAGLNCGGKPPVDPISPGGGPPICGGLDCGGGPPVGPPPSCGGNPGDQVSGMPGSAGFTRNPVSYAHGDKLYSAVDAYVMLPGQDFVFRRSYTSDPAFGGAGLVGANWTANVFYFMEYVDTTTLRYSSPGTGTTTLTFDEGDDRWKATGPTTQYIVETTLDIAEIEYDVWRLIEPGQWEADFPTSTGNGAYRGLPLQLRDAYGNMQTFEYTTYNGVPRLSKIYLNGTPDDDPAPVGEVEFTWYNDVSAATQGRLESITVKRGTTATQEVEYTYFDSESSSPVFDDAVGTDGDLVQVVRKVLVDTDWDSQPAWRVTVEQYRYHNETLNETYPDDDDDDDGFVEYGNPHQLKAIILPEQLEYAAQQDCASAPCSVEDFSGSLLTIADGADAFTDDDSNTWTVMQMASKVIARYEPYEAGHLAKQGRLLFQYLQTSCGCGGSPSHGLQLIHLYIPYTTDPSSLDEGDYASTLKILEFYYDETADDYVHFRTHLYDIVAYGITEGPYYYLANSVVQDAAGQSNWVQHYEYTPGTRAISRIMSPAALDEYVENDGPGSPPSYTAKTDAGLVIFPFYYSDHRLFQVRVREGDDPSLSNFHLVQRITYGDDEEPDERSYLPKKLERFRVVDSTEPTDTEVIEYAYGFHTSPADAIAWVEIKFESETVAENGPETNYYLHELYDDAGLNYWSRQADDTLTSREFDAATGQLSEATVNAATTGLPSSLPSNGAFSGRNGDGGALTVSYGYDLLGRVTSMTGASGVETRVVRELRESTERPGIDYYVETKLPHTYDENGEQFAGAATVTWFNAANRPIQVSTFEVVDDDLDYDYGSITGASYDFSLDTELSRATIQQNLTGLIVSRKQWHNFDEEGEAGGIYKTVFDYDSRGRLVQITAPNKFDGFEPDGTVTAYDYDFMDRLVEVADPSGPLVVAEYEYDGGGVGDGNLTSITEYEDGSTSRTTEYVYDFRDRLIKTVNPEAPHAYLAYDNLDRVIKQALFDVDPSGIDVSGERNDRGLYVRTDYSQRGLPYKQSRAIDPHVAEASMAFLESNLWYDQTGRIVGAWGPNAPGQKLTYDGLGRPKAVYVTDRGGDELPGDPDNYDDVFGANNLDADVVLEQVEYRYIEPGDYTSDLYTGLLELETHRARTHDATDTGDLADLAGSSGTDTQVITTYAAACYDKADRQVRSVEYGTNRDDFSASPAATDNEPGIEQLDQEDPPTWNTTGAEIVAEITYDERGLVATVTDPTGQVTAYLYDDLNRRIAVIENVTDFTADDLAWDTDRWSVIGALDADAPDEDRVTSFVYDGVNNVRKAVAHLPGGSGGAEGSVHVTQYDYGVTTSQSPGPSEIESDDLLRAITYPDSSQIVLGYNRLGEVTFLEDPNGTKHALEHDQLGRVTVDEVTTFGTNVDQTIEAITTTFDDFGRVASVKSFADYSSGTPRDEVQFEYTDLWQVQTLRQAASGAVSGSSPTVVYEYDTVDMDEGNYSRLTTMTYPDGSELACDYGSGTNESISRLRELALDTTPGTIAIYDYLGLGTVAVMDLDEPGVQLDRTASHTGERNTMTFTHNAGLYPGFDRFGRIARQMWVDTDFQPHATETTHPKIPPIVELTYTYDKASNRRTAHDENDVLDHWTNRDFEYDYDKLHRLETADRGNAESTPFYAPLDATFAASRQWGLDMPGNWIQLTTDEDADGADPEDTGDAVEGRTHNAVNELLDRDFDASSPPDLELTYDDNGNLVSEARTGGEFTYKYDAWNRLVRVWVDTDERGHYAYNGLNWRTIKRSDTILDGVLDQQRTMLYGAGWQLLEERVDDDYVNDQGVNRLVQYVWGLRYVDDVILHRIDDDFQNSGYERTYYHLTDAQFSTRAIIDEDANLIERVSYTAYGEARHHRMADLTGDGWVGINDYLYLLANYGHFGVGDVNRDGVVGINDNLDLLADWADGRPRGQISYSSVDNQIGWDGYVFNPEAGQYHVRFRVYAPELGRWLSRDPAGYLDGMSLYEYVAGSAVVLLDPYGLGFWRGVGRGLKFAGLVIVAAALLPEEVIAVAAVAGAYFVGQALWEFGTGDAVDLLGRKTGRLSADQRREILGELVGGSAAYFTPGVGLRAKFRGRARPAPGRSVPSPGRFAPGNAGWPRVGDVRGVGDIPRGWREWPSTPNRTGAGLRYTDPTNRWRQVRIYPRPNYASDPLKMVDPRGYTRYTDGCGGKTPPLPGHPG